MEALDRRGWERSYHQRYFHDNFIRACARVFWKVSWVSFIRNQSLRRSISPVQSTTSPRLSARTIRTMIVYC